MKCHCYLLFTVSVVVSVTLLPVLYSWDVPGTPSPGSQDVPPEDLQDLQDPPDLPEGLQDRRSRPGSVGLGLAGES